MTDAIDEAALAEAYERGLACEKAGDLAGAVAAFRRVLAIDPEDRGGAAVRLAALGEGPVPETAPPAYVALLFDQHAEAFDEMLVDQLGYHTPMELRERLRERGFAGCARLLDLGCGTGLTGQSLRDMAEHLTGVDLSEGMLAVADEKGVYDDLYVGDAEGFLMASAEEEGAVWDLIVATDVLPYVGALEGLFAAAAACLAPGGGLAVSTETLPEAAFEGRGYRVGPKQRFAHAEGYLRTTLTDAGLTVEEILPITVRHDEGAPIPGHLVFARKP
jgi:2-polyprenyl-6-hydroxyphenyl methylase/3-demethylubiquinone-9 3-methyltransferase